jgi:hypothetical protein
MRRVPENRRNKPDREDVENDDANCDARNAPDPGVAATEICPHNRAAASAERRWSGNGDVTSQLPALALLGLPCIELRTFVIPTLSS